MVETTEPDRLQRRHGRRRGPRCRAGGRVPTGIPYRAVHERLQTPVDATLHRSRSPPCVGGVRLEVRLYRLLSGENTLFRSSDRPSLNEGEKTPKPLASIHYKAFYNSYTFTVSARQLVCVQSKLTGTVRVRAMLCTGSDGSPAEFRLLILTCRRSRMPVPRREVPLHSYNQWGLL